MRSVRVNVAPAPYDVTVRAGVLDTLGEALAPLTRSRKVGLVTDSVVGPLYAGPAHVALTAAGFEVIPVTLPAGEAHKTLTDLLPAYDALLRAKIDRTTPIVALGGGVIGDMAGFLAATVLRGVPFVQVPTTLLAMVDASVGGKTGVDHAVGKNLIGAFHQPIAVFIDPLVLRTLPPRELRSGLGECIKHDVIRDAEGFTDLEQNVGRALALDVDYLEGLIAHNVAIKARVVEADPFEQGERAHLNFGHTFGHAIETVSNYQYAHGECVALGMVAASRCAADLGTLDDASCRRIVDLIAKVGLRTRGMALDPLRVIEAMHFDKKNRGGRIRFVLPDRIGHVVTHDGVPPDVVRRAVESLRE